MGAAVVADPELPPVEIDRDAIKRAMINLLDNAVAACREVAEGGRVTVTLAHEPRFAIVRLEVADNGTGMRDYIADWCAEVFAGIK